MAEQIIRSLGNPGLSRRDFLGASMMGTAAIYAGSGLALLTTSPSVRAQARELRVLRAADAAYFTAMLPAVIVQARSPEASSAFLVSIERMLAPAAPNTLGAIRDLVDLLTGSLTRPLMTLTWTDWPKMTPDQAAEILEDWRSSGFGLKRIAYALTTSLIRTAWYMQPDEQAVTGYPGSPKKIVEASVSAGEA